MGDDQYDRTVHRNKKTHRPSGGYTLFLDGSTHRFRPDRMGPEGKRLDTTLGNCDWQNNLGFRAYFWGTAFSGYRWPCLGATCGHTWGQ